MLRNLRAGSAGRTQRHGLGRYPMDVHADIRIVSPQSNKVEGAGGQHDNYGSALAAHPG